MGFFNLSRTANVEQIAKEVRLYSAIPGEWVGNDHYDPAIFPQPKDYSRRMLYILNRGVRGNGRRVMGEQQGIIDFRYEGDADDFPLADVKIPVKHKHRAIEYLDVFIKLEDLATDLTTLQTNKFCTTAIARAVLLTASGDQQHKQAQRA